MFIYAIQMQIIFRISDQQAVKTEGIIQDIAELEIPNNMERIDDGVIDIVVRKGKQNN